MHSEFWPLGGCPGILHHYTETLTTFEFTSDVQPHKPHSILFVGGLGDGLGTTSYLHTLVKALESTQWSVFSLNLETSYHAWGLGNLDNDVNDITKCVNYIKDYKAFKYGNGKLDSNDSNNAQQSRIVLMGHSTGSQDILHYLYRPNPNPPTNVSSSPSASADSTTPTRPVIDGAILQAPVSDREALQLVLQHGYPPRKPAQIRPMFHQALTLAKEAAAQGRDHNTLLPLWITSNICYSDHTPISCRRFLSLTSQGSPEDPSEDDLFSSDLGDEALRKTFGVVRQRGLLRGKFCMLVSGADQSVPAWVDKEALLERWRAAFESRRDQGKGVCAWDGVNSGIIPDASHALSSPGQEKAREELARRVVSFLKACADPS